MIQRIQTLFLLLALACLTVFFFFPFGNVIIQDQKGISDVALGLYGADFSTDNGMQNFSTLPLLIIISLSVATTVLTIFLYKRRILQIRLCVFNAIISLGCSGLALFFLYQASEKFGIDFSTNVLIVLPVVAAIFMFLALRSIAKDEALVRSIDRLR